MNMRRAGGGPSSLAAVQLWKIGRNRQRDGVPDKRSCVSCHQAVSRLSRLRRAWVDVGVVAAAERFIAGATAGREPENLGLGVEEKKKTRLVLLVVLFVCAARREG